MQNNKVVIPIVVGIIIVIIGIIATSYQENDKTKLEDTLDKELISNEEITPEIQEKLDEIKQTNLENEYSPKPREWITSGPFQIDRSEYVLGEKVLMRIGGLNFEEEGLIVFLKPLNITHNSVYLSIPFDGGDKSAFNYYFQPKLAKMEGICTVDDLIGDWKVVFVNTNYSDLEFKVTEQILPGDEKNYEPIC